MSPENKNLMYHTILDILNKKYPEKKEGTNKEAAQNVVQACEALEDVEETIAAINKANAAGESTETILSSIFKRVG